MKRHRSKHLRRVALFILLAFGTLTLASLRFTTEVRASDSVSNFSNITKLLTQFQVTSMKVIDIERLLHHQRLRFNDKREYLLKTVLSDQRQAAIAYGNALHNDLRDNPEAVILLKNYAKDYNAWLVAKGKFDMANRQLYRDQETIRNIQRDLKAATSGGQSDMNLELGSMRLKLIHLSERIPSQKTVAALNAAGLDSSSMNLRAQIQFSKGNPIALIAIQAMEEIHATQEIPAKLSANPFSWNWILN